MASDDVNTTAERLARVAAIADRLEATAGVDRVEVYVTDADEFKAEVMAHVRECARFEEMEAYVPTATPGVEGQ